MGSKTRSNIDEIDFGYNVWSGSVSEKIIKALYSGSKSKKELLDAAGCKSGSLMRKISFLLSKNIISMHEQDSTKYYSLTDIGRYLYLCIRLEINFTTAKALALAYYNFDVSKRKNLPIDFPLTMAEVEAKVSVYGFLCSEEAAWVRAKELACRGFGYLRNGCFVLYPCTYEKLKEYDSILRSLYSHLSEVPGRAALLMLRENPVLREKIERFVAVST